MVEERWKGCKKRDEGMEGERRRDGRRVMKGCKESDEGIEGEMEGERWREEGNRLRERRIKMKEGK
jgi:hypothetical protein